MKTNTLYEDSQIRVTYLLSPETGKEEDIISAEDHELWVKERRGEWNRYMIGRGILKELARTSREDRGRKLETIHPGIRIELELLGTGLNIDSLGVAISQAYIEDEERSEGSRRTGAPFQSD
ncbi:MAG: hypothetical protein AABW51_00075 [Nanoarchaeota archaeon]